MSNNAQQGLLPEMNNTEEISPHFATIYIYNLFSICRLFSS